MQKNSNLESLRRSAVGSNQNVFLMTLSGNDQPGITSRFTGILANHPVKVLDISQAVIQKLLTLSILFEVDCSSSSEEEVLKDLIFEGNKLDLKIEFQKLDLRADFKIASSDGRLNHYAVTLISDCVTALALHEVTRVLAQWKMNIDVIKRLSEGQFSCVEMLVSSHVPVDERVLRKELLSIAKDRTVDIALQAEGLYRRSRRLVVLDMDSTLIQNEVIDELAREKGAYDQVSKITHDAMQGKMDYDESLRLRCATLQGLGATDLERVYQKIQLMPGARDFIYVLKKLGYKVALISGGFSFVADRLKDQLGIDFAYANTLEIQNGILTGRVLPPIVNAQRKADLLDVIAQQERIHLDQVIAIGDGANDLLMLEKAGLGIAFNAKPLVRERADLALSQRNMRSILYLLGLSARDVEECLS